MGRFSSREKTVKMKLVSVLNGINSHPQNYVKNPGKDMTRKRVLSLRLTMEALIGMEGNSLVKETYHFGRNQTVSFTPSAFVQARDKIRPEAFRQVMLQFNEACEKYNTEKYRGYRLIAVDGTKICISRDPESNTYFEQKGKKGYNQIHISALYDVLNNYYLDAVVNSINDYNEPHECFEMFERTSCGKKTILLADRGYGSNNLFMHCFRYGVDFVIRVKEGFYSEFKAFQTETWDTWLENEYRTTLSKKDKSDYSKGEAKYVCPFHTSRRKKKNKNWDFESPARMRIRFLRFQLNDGSYEIIATSLPEKEFTVEDLRYLYNIRWGIEVSFKNLKYALGLTAFHSKKYESIVQEVFAKLIAYNYCMRIISAVTIKDDTGTKYEYQLNLTMSFYLCMEYFRCVSGKPPDITRTITRYMLPVRPNRKYERNIGPQSFKSFVYRIS